MCLYRTKAIRISPGKGWLGKVFSVSQMKPKQKRPYMAKSICTKSTQYDCWTLLFCCFKKNSDLKGFQIWLEDFLPCNHKNLSNVGTDVGKEAWFAVWLFTHPKGVGQSNFSRWCLVFSDSKWLPLLPTWFPAAIKVDDASTFSRYTRSFLLVP